MAGRRKKFLAVTPLSLFPGNLYPAVRTAFGGTEVRCQLCGDACVVDSAIDVSDVEIFYCINCSGRAGLTVTEVVEQLVAGLEISYARFLTLIEILRVEPGTRRYEALVDRLRHAGVAITGLPPTHKEY